MRSLRSGHRGCAGRERGTRRPSGRRRSGARRSRAPAARSRAAASGTAATAASRSSTAKPVTPSSITSAIDPRRKATTGVPQAIASTTDRPNGSANAIGCSSTEAPPRMRERSAGPTDPRYSTSDRGRAPPRSRSSRHPGWGRRSAGDDRCAWRSRWRRRCPCQDGCGRTPRDARRPGRRAGHRTRPGRCRGGSSLRSAGRAPGRHRRSTT